MSTVIYKVLGLLTYLIISCVNLRGHISFVPTHTIVGGWISCQSSFYQEHRLLLFIKKNARTQSFQNTEYDAEKLSERISNLADHAISCNGAFTKVISAMSRFLVSWITRNDSVLLYNHPSLHNGRRRLSSIPESEQKEK